MTHTLNSMREAVTNGTAQILTLDLATALKGKEIATIYFGYKGQDGFKQFVVGEIIEERKQVLALLDNTGKNTYIRIHTDEPYGADGVFTCSDSDRIVYFLPIKYPDQNRTVKTKEEAIAGARAEMARFFGLDSFEGGDINEIAAGECEAVDYLPAVQLLAGDNGGSNTTWRYTN